MLQSIYAHSYKKKSIYTHVREQSMQVLLLFFIFNKSSNFMHFSYFFSLDLVSSIGWKISMVNFCDKWYADLYFLFG